MRMYGSGHMNSGRPGIYLLPPATKFGQGNIFRSVCQEFCHPPESDTSGSRHPLGSRDLPQEQCMLGDTGNKGAVPMLLECILVFKLNLVHLRSVHISNYTLTNKTHLKNN